MANNVVNGAEVQDMVTHWLGTPPNGYLGSGYGSDPHALLQKPQSAGLADAFLDKLMADVQILDALPANAVNIYAEKSGNDKQNVFIEIFGSRVSLDNLEFRT